MTYKNRNHYIKLEDNDDFVREKKELNETLENFCENNEGKEMYISKRKRMYETVINKKIFLIEQYFMFENLDIHEFLNDINNIYKNNIVPEKNKYAKRKECNKLLKLIGGFFGFYILYEKEEEDYNVVKDLECKRKCVTKDFENNIKEAVMNWKNSGEYFDLIMRMTNIEIGHLLNESKQENLTNGQELEKINESIRQTLDFLKFQEEIQEQNLHRHNTGCNIF